jgi:hypothetical protein
VAFAVATARLALENAGLAITGAKARIPVAKGSILLIRLTKQPFD